MLGYELWVTPEAVVQHLFRARPPFPVQWVEVLHNRLRLAFVHFGAARIARVARTLGRYPAMGQAMCWLLDADVASRRAEMAGRRVRDDNWVFERFGLKW
jgi:hypothetical protein